mmetsp:Transcript_36067/g.94831  ORF Transcript_36067/g.94831 Transcript_36067/m.94831 type:complete len:178 (+) Transcript_36067:132-665(+)|eukprot:CAMPEP_0113684168 /NCGR_PEP_ID=MMETSP0038_2-20120614/13812_1 /TAXON_ID=2898 /ORGANISM="Cryptomonas paramecium" /LENGTH=177 /DNA_ID=CAMNT_0000603805 /DNA_START=70 /DNA_END=603 /DNA_ORIENTATION=+ /assembly_acc=CAM_ASM_000170
MIHGTIPDDESDARCDAHSAGAKDYRNILARSDSTVTTCRRSNSITEIDLDEDFVTASEYRAETHAHDEDDGSCFYVLFSVECHADQGKHQEIPSPYIRRNGCIVPQHQLDCRPVRRVDPADVKAQPSHKAGAGDLESRYKLRRQLEKPHRNVLKEAFQGFVACIQPEPLDPEWTVY